MRNSNLLENIPVLIQGLLLNFPQNIHEFFKSLCLKKFLQLRLTKDFKE